MTAELIIVDAASTGNQRGFEAAERDPVRHCNARTSIDVPSSCLRCDGAGPQTGARHRFSTSRSIGDRAQMCASRSPSLRSQRTEAAAFTVHQEAE